MAMMEELEGGAKRVRRASLKGLLGVFALAFASVSWAADSGEGSSDSADSGQKAKPMEGGGKAQGQGAQQNKMQQMRKLRSEFMQVRRKLNSLRKEVLKNNEGLKKQQDELKTLVEDKMSDQDPEASSKKDRMKQIRDQVKKGEVSKKKRKSLISEYQKIRKGLQSTQRKVQQDKEVQKKQKAYREELKKAMKEQDPKAEQLFKRMDELTKQLRSMMSPGGGAGAKGGSGG